MDVQNKVVVAAQYQPSMVPQPQCRERVQAGTKAQIALLDVCGQSVETAPDMQRRAVQARRAVIV
jgi:hypothetical protein